MGLGWRGCRTWSRAGAWFTAEGHQGLVEFVILGEVMAAAIKPCLNSMRPMPEKAFHDRKTPMPHSLFLGLCAKPAICPEAPEPDLSAVSTRGTD
jgi:hypothetical protein